jgi:hypothetical protein
MFMRYAHEVHACEVHAYEVYTCQIHAHKVHACEMHVYPFRWAYYPFLAP